MGKGYSRFCRWKGMHVENGTRQVINPLVPVANFKLADGVVRKFCWDMNAMVVFAEEFKKNPCRSEIGVARIMLLAGFHSDAIDRGETEWNLRTIGKLVSPELLEDLIPKIMELRKHGVAGPGESRASKSTKARKRK